MRILLVEYDKLFARTGQQTFRYESFVVNHVDNEKEAISALFVPDQDFVTLDLGILDIGSLELLNLIRERKIDELYSGEDYVGIGPPLMGIQRLVVQKKLKWEAGFFTALNGQSKDHILRSEIEFEF